MSEVGDPRALARDNLRVPGIKRFYQSVGVDEQEGGWALKIDGRNARTPAKKLLMAPTRDAAELIAQEWARQGALIDPFSMPVTRLANSAIDGIAAALTETQAEVARYATADLVCYRVETPETLAKEQAAAFDPILEWARESFGARFILTAGIVHVAQPEPSLRVLREIVGACSDPFPLGALHVMTSMTGSLLIALATAQGQLGSEAAWRAAHVDEDFQIRLWGEDEEATTRRAARWLEFEAASRLIKACEAAC